MKTKTKHILIGIFIGVTLTVTVAGAGLYGLVEYTKSAMDDVELDVPQFPNTIHVNYEELGLTDLDGNAFDTGQLKGKVVVLNAWATWCIPCVKEAPVVISLQEKLQDHEDIVVYFVNHEEIEEQNELIKREGFSPEMFLYSEHMHDVLDYVSYPTAFVISKEGMIVYNHSGAAKWDADEVIDYLTKLAE